MSKLNIILIANLYALPWDKNRGIFNQQQVNHLKNQDNVTIKILVPVSWLTWFSKGNFFSYTQTHEEIEVKYFPYFYTPKFGRKFYALWMYYSLLLQRKWIRNNNTHHLMASWGYPEGVAVARLANKLGISSSIKLHGTDVNDLFYRPNIKPQMLKAFDLVDFIYTVSKDLASKINQENRYTNKIHTIYNGVNHKTFKPTESEKKNQIIFIGNLKVTKGIIDLIDAFALSNLNKTHTLLYIGEGADRSILERKIKEYSLEKKVYLLGKLPHKKVVKTLCESSLMCLPSHNEGVPNVLLESLACGIPSVCTRVGGIPEVLPDYAGFLVDVKNINMLSTKLIEATHYKWNSDKIALYSNKFNWDKNALDLLERIKSVAKL